MIDNIFKFLVDSALIIGLLFIMWQAIDGLFSAIHNLGGC